MNREEAEKVLTIMTKADGGCVYCVRELFNLFIQKFPEFTQLTEEIFRIELGKELKSSNDYE